MNVQEVRQWITLGFAVVGGISGLAAVWQNVKQRRLENTFRLILTFRESQDPDWLDAFRALFELTAEPAGAKPGEYISKGYGPRPISDYFSEGSPDNHAVSRLTENLEVVCHEVCNKTVDARYVWFEFGQILSTIHYWISNTSSGPEPEGRLLDNSFPAMKKMFKKYGERFKKWPTKRYIYLE
jgi:hypothetical protein